MVESIDNCVEYLPYSLCRSNYELVWSQDFNYRGAVDEKTWSFEEGFIRRNEKQYYTKRDINNVLVSKGNLSLIAQNIKDKHNSTFISSGSINTKGKFEFTYGFVEARVKLPKGLGSWAALWTLGANQDLVKWPMCGEIDVFEYLYKTPEFYYSNAHYMNYKKYLDFYGTHRRAYKHPISPSQNEFHIFSIYWSEKSIYYFYDYNMVTKFNFKNSNVFNDAFNKPHYIIVNLALGGWGGDIDYSSFPIYFDIDYIRVFQRNNRSF